MKKRILSLLIALCLVVGLVPAVAAEEVASGTCGENLTWVLTDDGALTISGDGEMNDFGYDLSGIYRIAPPWDDHKNDIQLVYVEAGVTSIGKEAFRGYSNITSVELADSVTSIGEGAFTNCTKLSNISISNSLTEISDNAFLYCAELLEFSVPNSLTTIGANAFSGCEKVISFSIPASVTKIGKSAFKGCSSADGFWVDNNNQYYSCDSFGVLYDKAQTRLMQAPGLLSGEYRTLSTIERIDTSAFSGCDYVTSITVLGSITDIKSSTFSGCNSLSTVSLPNTVTSIGEYAFSFCSKLTDINLPESLTEIGSYAFQSCESLKQIAIPGNVSGIGLGTFSNCTSLKKVTFADGLTSIDTYAFSNCKSLSNIEIPSSVSAISNGAFLNCESLTVFGVDADNLNYSSDAYGVLFNKDKTTLIAVPCGMTGFYAIPANVTTIGNYALAYCNKLTHLAIPATVTDISYNAAYTYKDGSNRKLDNLNDVYYEGTEEQWSKINMSHYDTNAGIWAVNVHYNSAAPDSHPYTPAVTAPTCTEQGCTTWTCACGYSYMEYSDPLGHSFINYVSDNNATCTVDGTKTAKCDRCDETNTVVDSGSAHHTYTSVITAATCTESGFTTHTCSVCGDSYTDTLTDALGHDYQVTVTVDPTCTEDGYVTHVCSRCSDSNIEATTRLGHETITTIVEPTCTENGYTLTICVRCDLHERSDETDATGHNWSGTVCTNCGANRNNPFTDVPADSFYYSPVMWAVANGITNGLTETTFGPTASCNRAQVVTFLYRAYGENAE